MPVTQDSQLLQTILTAEDTFATTLLTVFVDTYGTEGFQWSPETIRMEVDEDFRITMPDANFDRLMAAINLCLSNDFYKSLPDFITYCNILSGDTYDPRAWDPADATECAWGITEGLLISPPEENDEQPFAEDITGYIGQVLDQEGIINPPDVLKIAVRSSDPSNFVAGEYSDDPDMFNSIYDLESSKTGQINEIIRGNLQRLSQQLDSLPLRAGSAIGAVQRMSQSLSGAGETGSDDDNSAFESF